MKPGLNLRTALQLAPCAALQAAGIHVNTRRGDDLPGTQPGAIEP